MQDRAAVTWSIKMHAVTPK